MCGFCVCTHVVNIHYVKFALISSCYVQVQNPHNIKYNGTIQGLKYIWRTEGFRGLFKGNGTNCARIVPNSAVKFFSYEEASKYVYLKISNLIGWIGIQCLNCYTREYCLMQNVFVHIIYRWKH